ncbi:alpha,alpha-trehalose-phosphate synthase (UDP-forming) [Anaeromyxobacter oryzae]|uniref:Trehalose-6-phosphate synthase n=1 Tax=Anaeromyxobacter oryzae TaxID=2918170 RepID=A0ABN6N2R2_9BACT|nr:trehalose-6-phosphate synthase [Anaeromyxobacter oryzae]BDG06303.1 trehalose-6-phosphate synthase [Anaeromyxobacter oryzae]
MRTFLRVTLPLLAGLALLAWGAALVVNTTARSWFLRDVTLRARLASAGAQQALAAHLVAGEQGKIATLLDALARDERILAAAVCSPTFSAIASTTGFPERWSCEVLGAARPPATAPLVDLDLAAAGEGGPVHVSMHAIEADGAVRGTLVLVHDMSYLARRERAMNRFTFGAFAVFGLLASVFTVVVRRASWRSWTDELRRLLSVARFPGATPAKAPPGAFSPILADLRALLAEVAGERSSAERGPWSRERLQRVLRETLHGDRVVILANREPYIHERGEDGAVRVQHPASGLVTALEPVMRACSGTWVAHGSGPADRETVDRDDRIRVPPGEESYALRRVWLSREEERGYYYGFSNEGLWPLCHIADTRPEFRVADFRQYARVNRRFADAVAEEVTGPDPIVLVQDYHFALAPRMIRERLPRSTIITFWHIPWPNAERFGICPWERDLLQGLLGSSILGFHTQQHCNNFIDAVDHYLEARIDRERQAVVQGGRECLVRSYPISIEWPNRWAEAAPPPAECRRAVFQELGLGPDALLGVGVDRLDYTKGIEERLLAVERTLERFPHLAGRFTFAQLAAPSRTLIAKYRALNEGVERLAARINARFGSGSYRPIVLERAHHEPAAVFRYLRAADVCYVSSLHDGMNLVAKEFVAARQDERGVLVLSRFTGAARELTEALLVNPYDLEEASAALATALGMTAAEQAERMHAMRAVVAELNVYRWAGHMLADAARVRQRGRLSQRLSMGLRAVDGAPQ